MPEHIVCCCEEVGLPVLYIFFSGWQSPQYHLLIVHDLVCSWASFSEACLFMWEMSINHCVQMVCQKSFKDF